MAFSGAVTAPQTQTDPLNSRSATLATATTWTGTYADTHGVAHVTIAANSTYAVMLTIEESQDASTVDRTDTISVAAGTEARRAFVPARRYYRVKVENASGSTTTLRVETRQHGTPVDPTWLPASPAWREHRKIAVADVTTEEGEDWMSDQAINSRATTSDAIGIFKRASSGTAGFEAVAYWVDSTSSDAVVHDTGNVTLRPYLRFTSGGVTRVAYAGAARAKPPGEVMSFEDSAPGEVWLKVEDATSPGGATTHLQIYVQEVNR